MAAKILFESLTGAFETRTERNCFFPLLPVPYLPNAPGVNRVDDVFLKRKYFSCELLKTEETGRSEIQLQKVNASLMLLAICIVGGYFL